MVRLNQIWPDHKRQALVTALLFLVFPGYSQHWVALTHINQEWIPLLFYLVSFGLTARALRNPGHYLIQHFLRAPAPGRRVVPHRIFRRARTSAVHFYLGHYFRRDPGLQDSGSFKHSNTGGLIW